jgi:hypothetical protein
MSDPRAFVPVSDNHVDANGMVLVENLPDLSFADFRALVQKLLDRGKYGEDAISALALSLAAIAGDGSRVKLTPEGGLAVLATNRSGAALEKGDVVEPYSYWDVTDSAAQVEGVSSDLGLSATNSDAGKLYISIVDAGADNTIEVYSDSARTTKVAQGTDAGKAGGDIACAAFGGSGLSVDVGVIAGAVAGATASAVRGSLRGVQLAATSSIAACGVVYEDAADGAACWIVVAGECQIKVAVDVPFGAWLITSATTDGAIDVLYAADATKVQRGVARSIGRRSGVGTTVGARLELRGTWGV